jgi:hypothetical protein
MFIPTLNIPYAWMGLLLLAFGIAFIGSKGNYAVAAVFMTVVAWVLVYPPLQMINFITALFVTLIAGLVFMYYVFRHHR